MPTKPSDPEEQLEGFVGKFEPRLQSLIRAARKFLQNRFPTAVELAYDNYNFFVIGFGPSERPSECIVSIAAAASGVSLCFIRGAGLPDPARMLVGSGKQTRFVRLPSAETLERPELAALLLEAEDRAATPMPTLGRNRLVIRSISAKQRPRRRAPGG